jgi:CRISPR-associated protein Csb2
MTQGLLLTVRFHEGRYHGTPDWPPAPARLFQALVAGAARGRRIGPEDQAALLWLEQLAPPVIASPTARTGQGYNTFVPNNDLDAVGGDPRRISEIRVGKTVRPHLFDEGASLLYAWHFEPVSEAAGQAERICAVANRLYQLGRGVDMAWALGELLDDAELAERLARHGGLVHRPGRSREGTQLACPGPGSLASLDTRFGAGLRRFETQKRGRVMQIRFSQPPKPRFTMVGYDSPPSRFLFDLRAAGGSGTDAWAFAPWPLRNVCPLVITARDRAEQRLRGGFPDDAPMIERVLVGRDAAKADKASRVRIMPIPSIGHAHADRAIRRVLVEVPSQCPLRADDIRWAFSGLSLDPEGKAAGSGAVLVPNREQSMLEHYGLGDGSDDGFRLWRSVTPVALPTSRTSGRIPASQRIDDQQRAAFEVAQALRHAEVTAPVKTVRVQREPFDARGERVERFDVPDRFLNPGLRHVEIGFAEPVRGPLVIGNGRYLGLGLMAPVRDGRRDTFVFSLRQDPALSVPDAPAFLRAVRRAVMSLASDERGNIPPLFSGHEPDGRAARSGRHYHVFYAADDMDGDGKIDRLIVAAPWQGDRSVFARRGERAQFDHVLSQLREVRAGPLGLFRLGDADGLEAPDPLVGPARAWVTATPYKPTRRWRPGRDPAAFVIADVAAECERRGFPKPQVTLPKPLPFVLGADFATNMRLDFSSAVQGPLMLGRDSHFGGGLFKATGGTGARNT